MPRFGRRSLLGGTAGLAASTMLARPYIARAADKTLTVWWNQGFYPAEDQAFHDMVATWEKQSGYKMSLSMVEGNALDQKVISATATGQVPDLIYSDHGCGPDDAAGGVGREAGRCVRRGGYAEERVQRDGAEVGAILQ